MNGSHKPPRARRALVPRQRFFRPGLQWLEDRTLLDASLPGSYVIFAPYDQSAPSRPGNEIADRAAPEDEPGDELPHYLPPSFDLHDLGTGYLTGPASGDALTIARNYLTAHVSDMGLLPGDVAELEVFTHYRTDTTGIIHLAFRQRLNGLVIENTNVVVNVTADGRIINVAGAFVRDLGRFAHTASPQPALSALQAAAATAGQLGLQSTATATVLEQRGGLEEWVSIDAPGVSTEAIPAYLHYIATEAGVRLAWDLTLQTPDGQHWYNLAIDAADGSLLHGLDYVHHATTYNIYAQPVESPSVGSRSTVTDPWVFTPTPAVVPSPFGWHDTDGSPGAEYTITRGNNVYAYLDEDANNAPDPNGSPDGGAGLNFNFPLDLSQSPDSDRAAGVTNLFYWTNVLHDVHYLYGFNEVAGNFQANNYGRGGVGNDALNAEAQDGASVNYANFASPPDGSSPRMQVSEWTYTNPRRDGALDAGIIVHEYGHGVSNRLTRNGLAQLQSRGMGEGWSDWWALMFTQGNTAPTTSTARGVGTYVLGQPADGVGIRQYRYSYTIGDQQNETFRDFGFGVGQSTQAHAVGTRWASALWDLTVLLVQKYGYEPNLYNSTSTAGNIKALHLVMNGLKLQRFNPTFIEARNAILQADMVLYGGANQQEIWTAFARRGLGVNASTAGSWDGNLNENFDVPPTITLVATDASAAEPSDSATFTVTRTGPTTKALTVTFTVTGTATNGTDYTSIGTSVTIPVGAPSATITVSPLDDTVVEPSETVVLSLASGSSYIFGTPNAATVTIADNDSPALPTVTIAATDVSAGEPANTGTFTVTRTGPTTVALTVNLSVGGTATNGTDYTAIPTSVTIPAGASSVTITVSPIDDALVEGSETVVLTLSAGGSYQPGSPNAATVSIADNDSASNSPPVLQPITDRTIPSSQQVESVPLSASDLDGDPSTFSASAQSLAYALKQQYALYSNGNFYVNVYGKQDKWVRGSGTGWYFLLPTGNLYQWDGVTDDAVGTLLGNVGLSYYDDPYRLVNAAANDAHVSLAVSGNTLTVTRDPSWVSAAVIAVTASDGKGGSDTESFKLVVTAGQPAPPTVTVAATDASAGEPANPGTFIISRAGSTATALTVNFIVTGTATNGTDYTAIPTSVTIPAGAASVAITVSPLDDALVEGSETVVLTLSAGGSYQVGSPNAATVSIADNDSASNSPPVLQPITNRTVPSSQQTVSVNLSASDPDGDPLTFSATAQSLAYLFKQQYGLYTDGNLYSNYYGKQEKWVKGGGTGWYFLLPNGELYQWDGVNDDAVGTLLGNVGASYHQDPYRLVNAAANDAHVSLAVSGNTLTITRDLSWVSAIVITVTASDGKGGMDSESFTVTVTS